MSFLKNYFLSFGSIFLMLLSLLHIIYTSDTLSSFYYDEVANNQAAVSLLSNGNYKNDRYGTIYSSGFIVTWPGAVGWLIGKNILSARIACGMISALLAVFLGFIFLKRLNYSFWESVALSICLWVMTITSPMAMPYWFGFLYNLGELNSILIIALALFLISKRPYLMVFIFGIAVWHGKLMYFAFVVALILGHLITLKLSFKDFVFSILKYAFVFVLPLVIWLGLLFFKLGFSTTQELLSVQAGWFSNNLNSTHSPLHLSWKYVVGRFTSPDLEWVGYTTGTKLKNLIFSLGAVLMTLLSLFVMKKKLFNVSSREFWLSLMACMSILFYSFLYFCIHPFMWQRHFQPALYIGFGLIVFWGLKWIKYYSWNIKKLIYSYIIFLILLQGIFALRNPLFADVASYARSCTDLYSFKCDPELYK